MPELPEVETARRLLARTMRTKRISRVEASRDPLVLKGAGPRSISAAMTGRVVKAVGRRGKYLWIELDRRPWPLIHLGLSGRISVVPADETIKFSKLSLHLGSGRKVVLSDARRLGRVRLVEDPETYLDEKGIGPDVMDEPPALSFLERTLSGRRAPIKAILMDQRFFAGVGNWVADETLFQARIAPRRPAGDLSRAELKKLRDKLLHVCRTAVRAGADPKRYPASWLFEHRWGRRDSAKVRGGHEVARTTVGGRSTAWVPALQR